MTLMSCLRMFTKSDLRVDDFDVVSEDVHEDCLEEDPQEPDHQAQHQGPAHKS